MKKEVICESGSGIMMLAFNRPQQGNTITREMFFQVSEACEEIAAEEKYKALIITGAGNKSFCTGKEKVSSDPEMELSIPALLSNVRCPVIAAINGDAFNEGLEIALACDIRIAAREVLFGLPGIEKGIIPSDGATQRLPRIIGITKTMEMILTGETMRTDEALRIGLISQIVESSQLLSCVKDMAGVMTTKSPLALSFAKEAINKGLDLTLDQGLRLEADLYFLLHTTEDRSEGIKAFREKRKPEFKGK